MSNRRHSGGFVADGWNTLHQAVLDRGAEIDYYPPDYPELKGRDFIDAELYRDLTGRVLDLAAIDVEKCGFRSTLIQRAVWRWIRRTAERDAKTLWRQLHSTKSWMALLAEFQDQTRSNRFSDRLLPSPQDLYSVARFGYSLFREGNIPDSPLIASIVWGLAIIGAAWGAHLRCSVCKLCFRRSRPGGIYCSFHSQGSTADGSPSEAYMRYRCGHRARQLALADQDSRWLLDCTPMMRDVLERLALPDVLFPLIPMDGNWANERRWLIECLRISPRVVFVAGIREFEGTPYDELITRLRKAIDPNEWSNDNWGLKVLQAEKWFQLEEEASPGSRGRGEKTVELVDQASALALHGHTNSEIASVLGVTSSAVSQWARRFPKFKEATLLRVKK